MGLGQNRIALHFTLWKMQPHFGENIILFVISYYMEAALNKKSQNLQDIMGFLSAHESRIERKIKTVNI